MARIGRRLGGVFLATVVAGLIPWGTTEVDARASVARGCATSRLSISVTDSFSGLGHGGMRLRFRNRGPTCILRGYPGVDGLDRRRHVVVHATRTPSGYLGGITGSTPHTVTLAEGKVATALLEGLNGAVTGMPCHRYSSLRVTPPDEKRSVRLRVPHSVCYPAIHPLLAGRTGTSRGFHRLVVGSP